MREIVMLRNCNVGGKPRKINDKVNASNADAHYLTGRGLARYVEDLGEPQGLTTRSMKPKSESAGKKAGNKRGKK